MIKTKLLDLGLYIKQKLRLLRKPKLLGEADTKGKKDKFSVFFSRIGILEMLRNNKNIIYIMLEKKDEKEKNAIFEYLEVLRKYGIHVELAEIEQIFNDNDYERIASAYPNCDVGIRYASEKFSGIINMNETMNVRDWLKMLEKIVFLTDFSKQQFHNQDEQVMFIAIQLAKYIDYNTEQKNEYLNFSDALLKRSGVCAHYASVFNLCMDRLNVKSITVKDELRDYNTGGNVGGHAWNKVLLNDQYYSVDVTWLSGAIKHNIERDGVFKYILTSDKTHFDNKYTGMNVPFGSNPLCQTDYEKRMKIYENVCTVYNGNLLEEYDLNKGNTLKINLRNTEKEKKVEASKDDNGVQPTNDKKEENYR